MYKVEINDRKVMGSGFAKKKKEAKMFQQKFKEMQEKLKEERAVGTAGNGLVTVTLNGEHEMIELKIKPECVDPEDVEVLEDLIRAAYNGAVKQLEKGSISDMGLPGFGDF
jgi:DNA-binding YbaB/EbfC family protein